MATFDERVNLQPIGQRAGVFVTYAGAAVSLALVAGVGVWGYQLVMRDVTGIPVVRAMTGDMRVAPQDPGGSIAAHAGLSVNTVAAEGHAAGPEDILVLAPAVTELAEEDLEAQPMAEAAEVVPDVQATPEPAVETAVAATLNTVEDPAKPLSTDDILALADQIANGAAPLEALEEGADTAPEVIAEIVEETPAPQTQAAVTVSLRPVLRPAAPAASDVAAAVAEAVSTAQAQEVAVTTAAIPVGTNLVQLGAFPSPEGAASEWTRLSGKFTDYMSGKERVIQVAESGGRTFYRLRAMGFADISDARRFCAALDAQNTDCIPVVVR